MSPEKPNFPVAGLELTTTAEPNPALPRRLPEALLLGQYWKESSLLERLERQVQVKRGRAGRYETEDFVLSSSRAIASSLFTVPIQSGRRSFSPDFESL